MQALEFEGTGNENLHICLSGDVAQVRAALDAAEKLAPELGAAIVTQTIPRLADGFDPMIYFSNVHNSLYGGRDQLLPTDYPANPDSNEIMKPQAVGILETQGLTAILEATDTMLKAADVKLVGKEKIGAAIKAGKQAVGSLGKVIARPHDDLAALLPK